MSFLKGKKDSDTAKPVEYSGVKPENEKGKKVNAKEWDDFKDSHNNLYLDYIADQKKKVKLANSVSAIAVCIAVGAVGWHLSNPITNVEPYILRVDSSTGAVDVVSTIKDQATTQGVAVDKYWVAEFVRNFEGYDFNLIQTMYDKTISMSSPKVQAQYRRMYEGNDARHIKFGENTSITVDVISVIIDNNSVSPVARVRFKTTTVSSGRTTVNYWVASVGYKYDKKAMGNDARLLNPLGFLVTTYTVSNEVTP